jgi:hypothetical protein
MTAVKRYPARFRDGDCPKGILCIIRNEFTIDVIYAERFESRSSVYYQGREMSDDPYHPQGVGISFEVNLYDLAGYRRRCRHNYIAWSELTAAQRKCAIADIDSITNVADLPIWVA